MRARLPSISDDRGFSLIELLVAVAILSLAAVTLLESQTQAISLTSQVERRALAAIVAENQLAVALAHSRAPTSGSSTGRATQMGAEFAWRQQVRPAPGGDLMIVAVTVTEPGSTRELASLTGFRKAE